MCYTSDICIKHTLHVKKFGKQTHLKILFKNYFCCYFFKPKLFMKQKHVDLLFYFVL